MQCSREHLGSISKVKVGLQKGSIHCFQDVYPGGQSGRIIDRYTFPIHDYGPVYFDLFLKRYQIEDPALKDMAVIIRWADIDEHSLAAQSSGLWAISAGLLPDWVNPNLVSVSGSLPDCRKGWFLSVFLTCWLFIKEGNLETPKF